jgi:hypothetical protein
VIAVTFLRAHGIYNAGETAGFEPGRAAELIAANVAMAAGGVVAAETPEAEPEAGEPPAEGRPAEPGGD